jgi:DNA-binding transcriptional LysR family regulator
MSKWDDLTIGDLRMIEELAAHSSLRSWGKLHGSNAVYAARRLNQIEDRLQQKLTIRTNQGIALTREGERLARSVSELHQTIAKLDAAIMANNPEVYAKRLTIGARGFITTFFAGCLVQALDGRDTCLQLVEQSPSESLEAASRSAIDIAISLEPLALGKDWIRKSLGKFFWKIYSSPSHPLRAQANKNSLRKYRLAHQCYWNGKSIVSNHGDEHTVLGLSQLGFGSQSAFTAIEIAAHSDQIICIPEVVGNRAVKAGRIVAIETGGINLPETEVYAYINGKISRRLAAELIEVMTQRLGEP